MKKSRLPALLLITALFITAAVLFLRFIWPSPTAGNDALGLLKQTFPSYFTVPAGDPEYAAIDTMLSLRCLGISLYKVETSLPGYEDGHGEENVSFFIDESSPGHKAYDLRDRDWWRFDAKPNKEFATFGHILDTNTRNKDLAGLNSWLADRKAKKIDIDALDSLLTFHYRREFIGEKVSSQEQIRQYVKQAIADFENGSLKDNQMSITKKDLFFAQLDSLMKVHQQRPYPLIYASKGSVELTLLQVDTIENKYIQVKKIVVIPYSE